MVSASQGLGGSDFEETFLAARASQELGDMLTRFQSGRSAGRPKAVLASWRRGCGFPSSIEDTAFASDPGVGSILPASMIEPVKFGTDGDPRGGRQVGPRQAFRVTDFPSIKRPLSRSFSTTTRHFETRKSLNLIYLDNVAGVAYCLMTRFDDIDKTVACIEMFRQKNALPEESLRCAYPFAS